ncbi:metal-dependent hydrolase [Halococcus agarilyticus]|uniref:metal-dependent hydrolase n=1 Tax=Halococcus agarilyticus TaxID=1232219 RepID=UPI0006778CD4|nr:metal-dependent hydrolase [Halococcus agarilyticus]
MFVGHAMAGFALAAGGARLLGCSRERALAIGASTAAFAAVPDVDILYAPTGLLGAESAADAAEGFWATGNVVHRAATHSLVVATVAAVAFWLWSRASTSREDVDGSRVSASAERIAGLALLGGLIATVGVLSGWLAVFVTTAFVVAGLLVTVAAVRFGHLSPPGVFLSALVGLASHPFGDFFTGSPPQLFYPFDVSPVDERIVLAADPTVNLLLSFWIELATVWFGALVYCALTRRALRAYVHRWAAIGLVYVAAPVVVPSPTVSSASPFVFGVLAVGIVGSLPLVWRRERNGRRRGRQLLDAETLLTAILTGLAAVTVASVAYAVGYVVL